jgi:hypothetical protein
MLGGHIMFPTRRMKLTLVMAGALLLLAPLSRVALAQNDYNSTYFNTRPSVLYPIGSDASLPTVGVPLPAADNTIRFVNPTYHVNSISGIDTHDVGGLCAMIYVYDDDEEPIECCGCPITNDGVLTLSVEDNLTSNPFSGRPIAHGTIHVIAAAPNAPSSLDFCDATGQIGPIVPTPTIREWIKHVSAEVAVTPYPITGVVDNFGNIASITEVEFLPSVLRALQLTELENDCTFIRQDGSGAGVCTCGGNTGEPPLTTMPAPPSVSIFG